MIADAPMHTTTVSHTPGPWHVSAAGPTVYSLHGSLPRNRWSATLQGGRRDDAQALELMANARLCAAAPDLLAALINLLGVIDGEGGTQPNARETARAAIAKATGAAQPLPADCISRVHTHEDLLLAIGKATAMGARLGLSVRVAIVPQRVTT